jgi:multidrug resistance efflux pump
MDKEKLPPIPTPVAQRWREFRIQVLPFLVFLALLAVIVMLWRSFVQPVGVVGLAETNAVNIVATQDGLLSVLNAERFQMVNQGQELGLLINNDPDLLKAQIASAQADIEVLRARNIVDQDRTEQSYQQFRQELFTQRIVQATDRVNWFVVSNDFVRASNEFQTKIISEAQYDAAKGKLYTLTTNIAEREIQIQDLTKTLAELQAKRKGGQPDAFDKAVEAKGHELDLMLKPTAIKAPIGGVISFVHHAAGERVLRGMPILTISEPRATRIIGYVRQPIQNHPSTNDSARITTRGSPRQIGIGPILKVGAQLEPINPALLSAETKRMEVGLPIVVGVPPGMTLLPGEFIDLSIKNKK